MKAQEENNRKVKELEEMLKQEQDRSMAEALTQTKALNLKESNAYEEKKMQEQEEERQRKLREQETKDRLHFEKMKGELLAYEFGDKLSNKAFETEGIDCSDMERLVVAMFGPAGSGKTSFIGEYFIIYFTFLPASQ